MTQTRAAYLLLAVALCFQTACTTTPTRPLATPVQDTGVIGAAPYHLDIPKGWNGDLVIWLHGYEPKGNPRQSPLPQNEAAPLFLTRGYAVAASAYSSQGWSVADAVPDTERLRSYFVDKYRKPRHTYLVGFSLGGLVALKSIELHGEMYDGGLSLCGVNMPSRTVFQEAVLTPLVSFDYFFPNAMGLAKGGLADPDSPTMLKQEELEDSLKQNEQVASLLSKRLSIPRSGLAGALALYNLVLREATSRAGGFPVDNRAVTYSGFGDDQAFNRGVRRYAGDADAIAQIDRSAELTGKIKTPIVLQPSANDPIVSERLNSIYPELVRLRGLQQLLLVLPPLGDGHCDFSGEQITDAFDHLLKLQKR